MGQDPREFWYLNDTDEVLGFLEGLRTDLEDLARKFSEWELQDGLGALSATLRGQWLHIPLDVVGAWLREESAIEGQECSDTLYQVVEIFCCETDSIILGRLAGASGKAAPPSIIVPTGLTDDEGETASGIRGRE